MTFNRSVMEYHLLNTNIHFSGLNEFIKVNKQQTELVLIGEVDAIVDYQNLRYITDKIEVQAKTEQVLASYISSPVNFHQLSVLSGNYVLLQIDSDQLVKIITSDSINPKVAIYYKNHLESLRISNDYKSVSPDQDLRQIGAYDQKVLNVLSKQRGGIPGRTYLDGVRKLDSRSVYSVSQNKIKKEAVVYPSDFRKDVSVENYLSVVGKKLPEEKFSLAYSSGIDSHVLLDKHSEKIDELCTYYFPYPNLGIEKTKAAGASVIQSIQRGMALPTLIEVDECHDSGMQFLKHNASFQVYTSHFALNFYRLAEESKNKNLILGESADAMAGFFTHTNEIYLKTIWQDRKKLFWRVLDNLNFHRKINKKYFADSLEYVLSCYDSEGRLKEKVDLTAISSIWPILLYFKSGQFSMNSVATIFAAADYFKKQVHCPYSEPLSHFMVSQWKKPFMSVFDPKKEIRKQYQYISDEEILGKIDKPSDSVEGSIFDKILNELRSELPELASHLDKTGVNIHARVHIACLALGKQ